MENLTKSQAPLEKAQKPFDIAERRKPHDALFAELEAKLKRINAAEAAKAAKKI